MCFATVRDAIRFRPVEDNGQPEEWITASRAEKRISERLGPEKADPSHREQGTGSMQDSERGRQVSDRHDRADGDGDYRHDSCDPCGRVPVADRSPRLRESRKGTKRCHSAPDADEHHVEERGEEARQLLSLIAWPQKRNQEEPREQARCGTEYGDQARSCVLVLLEGTRTRRWAGTACHIIHC